MDRELGRGASAYNMSPSKTKGAAMCDIVTRI